MSVFSVLGAFQEMKGRRMKPAGLKTRDFIALMTFCWRRARVRSFSFGLQRLWRVRARASACLPSMCVVPRCRRSVKPPFLKPPLMRDTTQPPV